MHCWKCGAPLENFPRNKVPFRATCDKCGSWLHCCKNCKNYKPGMRNDCKIPETDYIRDREAMNHCEYFELLGSAPPPKPNLDDIAKRLFKDD